MGISGRWGGASIKEKKRYPELVYAIVGRIRGLSPPYNYFPPATNKTIRGRPSIKNVANNKHAVPNPLLVVVSSPNIPPPHPLIYPQIPLTNYQ